MKRIIYILLVGLITNTAAGQQLPHLSQYMFNDFFMNPAVAGTKNYSPLMLTIRNQWTGLNDAPTTQTLSFHSPIFKDMGLGGIIVNDKTGPVSQTGIQLSYAYHLSLKQNSYLSFGLSGLLYQHVFDKDLIILDDPNDQAMQGGGKEKSIVPEASFGVHLYGKKYYVGFSAPQLFQSKVKCDRGSEQQINRLVRHYFVMGGYKFNLNEKFQIEPSLLFKAIVNAPVQVDINAKFIYMEMVWAGLSYRSQESIVAMLGFEYKKFSLGYSYDYTLTTIRKYSTGSHELFLAYRLLSKPESKKSKAMAD